MRVQPPMTYLIDLWSRRVENTRQYFNWRCFMQFLAVTGVLNRPGVSFLFLFSILSLQLWNNNKRFSFHLVSIATRVIRWCSFVSFKRQFFYNSHRLVLRPRCSLSVHIRKGNHQLSFHTSLNIIYKSQGHVMTSLWIRFFL